MYIIPVFNIKVPDYYDDLLEFSRALSLVATAKDKNFTLEKIDFYKNYIEVKIRATKCDGCLQQAYYSFVFSREGDNFICSGYEQRGNVR